MAMGAAALNDAAAWCLLVLAISLGQIISLQTDNTLIYPSTKPVFVNYHHFIPQPIRQIWVLPAMCSCAF
jgi:hypothetical protein